MGGVIILSEKLLNKLNEQVTHEFHAAHLYVSMAAYCDSIDLDGCSNFFLMQAEEERFHAMKLFNYISEQGEKVVIGALEAPQQDFDSVLDVFESALEHEKKVTSLIYKLMDIATEEREYATISFLNWYVDEQVEEEASFSTLIEKFKAAEHNKGLLHMLDEQLGQRKFEESNDED